MHELEFAETFLNGLCVCGRGEGGGGGGVGRGVVGRGGFNNQFNVGKTLMVAYSGSL